MLKLKRRPGERIVISHPNLPGDIVLEHFPAGGGNVQQGITAPDSVRILRAELLETEPQKPPVAA